MCRKVIWDQVENVGARPSSAHQNIMISKALQPCTEDIDLDRGLGLLTFIPPALRNTQMLAGLGGWYGDALLRSLRH